MDKNVSATLVLVFLVIALLLLVLGWRNRSKRQSYLPPLSEAPAGLAAAILERSGLYVATTLAGDRLDRVAVRGLGFRSRVTVAVHPAGVVLSIPGQADSFIEAASVVAVSRSTWTIDRVVEDGGLVCLEWTLGETAVESFFRVEDSQELIDALAPLVPHSFDSTAHPDKKA